MRVLGHASVSEGSRCRPLGPRIGVLAHDAELGDQVDSLIEQSAEESLADASGCERSAGFNMRKRGMAVQHA